MTIKYTDFVLDLETLSLQPNAVIFEAAMVAFDFRDATRQIAWHLKPAPVRAHRGYDIDPSTLAFHDALNTGPSLEFLHACLTGTYEAPGYIDAIDFAASLEAFVQDHEDPAGIRIWAQGKDFDFPILLNYYRQQLGTDAKGKTSIPWEYWQQRCARDFKDNALDTYGEPLRVKLEALKATRLPPHNALNDCLNTIEVLRTCAGFMPDFK